MKDSYFTSLLIKRKTDFKNNFSEIMLYHLVYVYKNRLHLCLQLSYFHINCFVLNLYFRQAVFPYMITIRDPLITRKNIFVLISFSNYDFLQNYLIVTPSSTF